MKGCPLLGPLVGELTSLSVHGLSHACGSAEGQTRGNKQNRRTHGQRNGEWGQIPRGWMSWCPPTLGFARPQSGKRSPARFCTSSGGWSGGCARSLRSTRSQQPEGADALCSFFFGFGSPGLSTSSQAFKLCAALPSPASRKFQISTQCPGVLFLALRVQLVRDHHSSRVWLEHVATLTLRVGLCCCCSCCCRCSCCRWH